MHAQPIIQDLLAAECPTIHAKRRSCVAAMVDGASKGTLSLMGMSRALSSTTAIRHRIKRCDRLLGNIKLDKEPWLLAVSPRLASLSAPAVVAIYSGRMQIEQTFRDAKNARWGLGLSESQSRKPQRLALLLMIGTLACYALWLIGTAVKQSGYRIEFGSWKKAASALSIISLARWWLAENRTDRLSWRQIHAALILLRAKASDIGI
ncbi:MAG: transposase [Pseudomonadota bacterium]